MADSEGARVRWRDRKCKLLHRWRKNLHVDTSPFTISPLAGDRVCERCGKRQDYHYDSQGGYWTDA